MNTTTENVVKLDPKTVHISKLNTRQPKKEDVGELMESIRATGQITPAIVRPLDIWTDEPQAPEAVIWKGVQSVIGMRLQFQRNSDLLDADRRTDMERIAGLIGFDHVARWTEICTLEVPVPKSWGSGFDLITLEPTRRAA